MIAHNKPAAEPAPAFRSLLISIVSLSVLIPLLTFIIVVFGPEPVPSMSEYLADGVTGLIEVRDRVAVITWWFLTIVISSWFCFTAVFREGRAGLPVLKVRSLHALHGLITFILFAELLWYFGSPTTENVLPVQLAEVVITFLLVGVGVLLSKQSSVIPSSWWWLGGGLFITLLLPSLIQSPATLRDYYHFSFSSNELLAPSVGRFPLSNFVSQYSNLLGYPIAPLLNRLPARFDLTVVVAFLVTLQFFCIVTPSVIARILKRSWGTALALAVPTSILVASITDEDELLSVGTYFQGFPMRTVLPSALLLLLVWSAAISPRLQVLWTFLIGGFASLTILNNLDFGAPAALAAMIVVATTAQTLRRAVTSLLAYATGIFFLLFAMRLCFAITGNPLDLEYLWSITQIFGIAGYLNAPMAAGGLPIMVVLGMALGVLFGVFSLLRSRQIDNSDLLVASVFLLFSSLWGLFSLAYYSGRSFTSTAVGGHYFQLALVISGVILYVVLDFGHLQVQMRLAGATSKIIYIVSFAFFLLLTSGLLRLPSPADQMSLLWRSGSRPPSEQMVLSEISRVQERQILPEDLSETGQLLPISHSIERQTGAKSLLVFTHPSLLAVAPKLLGLQCSEIRQSSARYVIESGKYGSIFNEPSCGRSLAFDTRLLYKSQIIQVTELLR